MLISYDPIKPSQFLTQSPNYGHNLGRIVTVGYPEHHHQYLRVATDTQKAVISTAPSVIPTTSVLYQNPIHSPMNQLSPLRFTLFTIMPGASVDILTFGGGNVDTW
ncbi:hypothetical protein RP20_CCG027484 [Aedes albopictus]|nr:hypothetical protein RP20_CCG027484 [Aedes albopictus]